MSSLILVDKSIAKKYGILWNIKMDLQGTKYYFLIKPSIILDNLNQDQ